MAVYQILYWRDIPAQLRAFGGRKPVSHPLDERFQLEIDRIAMEEGLEGSDDYLDQWQWTEKRERPGSATEVLEVLARELEAEFAHLFGENQ
jgi:hypothetical protein